MRTLLKQITLAIAVSTYVGSTTNFSARADSTSSLILDLRCRGGYNVNVWKNRTSGKLLYRATSPNGKLSINGGTTQNTEGVKVYKFQNGNYQYWVWDGTLDSQSAGTLEVYRNNRIIMKRACTKK
ncbi:hypothetical protein G7B40_016850 [Aetokthonos hydrillicola Thurmond2011]|jgi:hypothetical protein|uniref:Uncharacterized protein n=1 Tax=Aetokthonos hydrillicola Thurmond2011 TaxID=2712845 RepID=A0AAP5IAJ6_9CYAN|nr:hypothetical protein [Aetokthonos hydrillicola]MBO3457694.1 hypothetical protein [Aetokthonos hydrillicola CCALA 1050]MBW4590869.1 hypothetical protein [Aetokthonos hydrillicola CCALA 1050]MDR9896218.1 hypothetical protein [Aetokthonos hydrillicola Thurmond2011]